MSYTLFLSVSSYLLPSLFFVRSVDSPSKGNLALIWQASLNDLISSGRSELKDLFDNEQEIDRERKGEED